jgi:hypothetical protein
MKMLRVLRRSGLFALSFGAALSLAQLSQAEIVANLGTLPIGSADSVTCALNCTTTAGTALGSLPVSGQFTHQIIFRTSAPANTISSTQILDNSTIDVANLTVQLFEWAGGSTVPGPANTATLGALLATAIPNTFITTTNFFLSYAGLDPAKTYVIQLLGLGGGVLDPGASYSQQVRLVPAAVPLPPALFLLGAALAGLVGFARMRRQRTAA